MEWVVYTLDFTGVSLVMDSGL